MKKERKNRLLIVILLLVVSIIGGTYAWFTYRSKESALVLSIGDLKDSRVTLSPYQIKETMTPVTDYTSGVYSQVEAVNNTSNNMVVTLYYKINELDENLANKGLSYTVVSSDTVDGTYTKVSEGTFENSSGAEEVVVLDTEVPASSGKVYYRVYVWLDSSAGDQTDVQNSVLNIELNADLDQEPIAPVLDDGMIPVTISNDGTVTTISSDDIDWYNYRNQEWANVVLVTSGSRSTYLNTTGVEVTSSDILAYYVWIPRYRYKIWTTGVSSTGSEQEIEILFETENENERLLNTDLDQYRTHPAFWWDNDSDGTFDDGELLPGIWVGKFETTGTADSPTVLPNVTSLREQNVSTQFATSLRFAGGTFSNSFVGFVGNNTYGLTSSMDSHMAKNADWGAVAYLSHSKYGINDEVRLNNNSNFTTGCGASSSGGSTTSTCEISYGNASSYPQSTTGNITGIFDMSGGALERVMGNYGNTVGDSGFSSMPNLKYYDLYSSTQFTGTSNNANMAFCTLDTCGGHALFETAGWYSDSNTFVHSSSPWFGRGGMSVFGGSSGVFYSETSFGVSSSSYSYRSVLVPISEEMQNSVVSTATISSTNDVATSQTVTLTMSSDSAVTGYYFGTSNPSTTSVTWTDVEYTSSTTATSEVSAEGTYYLGVRDTYGNVALDSKAFYKTTLDTLNVEDNAAEVPEGTVTQIPEYVITMEGNSFTLPTPTVSDDYTFKGWYNSSGDEITTYTPTVNGSVYAGVEVNIIYINKPTTSYCKSGLVYTGSAQTITNVAGEGYTFSGNSKTNAGSYTVTATLKDGYAWSDKTTANVTFSCSIGKATGTISLTAKSAVYTGSAIAANTATTNSGGTVSYVYYTNSSCSTKTSTTNGASASGGAPSKVGTFYVKATVAATTNYTTASTGCVTHKITDPAPVVSSVTATKSGSTITGKVTATDQGTGISKYYYYLSTSTSCPTSGYTSSTNSSYSFVATAAGTYYICAYVTDGSGNASAKKYSGSVTLTSGSGSITASNITVQTTRSSASNKGSVYLDTLTLGDGITSILLGKDQTSRWHTAQFTFKLDHATDSLTLDYVSGTAVTYKYPLYYKVLTAADTNYYYNYETSDYWTDYDGTWTPNGYAWTYNTVESIGPPSGSTMFEANKTYYMYVWGGVSASQYIRFTANTDDYPMTFTYSYLS